MTAEELRNIRVHLGLSQEGIRHSLRLFSRLHPENGNRQISSFRKNGSCRVRSCSRSSRSARIKPGVTPPRPPVVHDMPHDTGNQPLNAFAVKFLNHCCIPRKSWAHGNALGIVAAYVIKGADDDQKLMRFLLQTIGEQLVDMPEVLHTFSQH